ncbi:MAG: alpha/beta fold hydrolase [Pseudomonadota bacterium]
MQADTLVTRDGRSLAAHRFPAAGSPRAVVVLAPAMGVPQAFYAPFATGLSQQGFTVLSFDYRGMGLSRTQPLRTETADLLTWGREDGSAALDHAEALAGGAPLLWLGHSVGGQLIPFLREPNRLAGALLVAAGSGYWRDNAAPLKRRIRAMWWGLVPVLTPLFGYFPGARIGAVGDLPRGVIWQWRAWCLDPNYTVGVIGKPAADAFAAVRVPLHALYFADDEFLSRRSIESLNAQYVNAPLRFDVIEPQAVSEARCGHLAVFRPRFEKTIWHARFGPALTDLATGNTAVEGP